MPAVEKPSIALPAEIAATVRRAVEAGVGFVGKAICDALA